MSHADPMAAGLTHGAHVLVESIAAVVLIAAGLVVLGLMVRRSRLGLTSSVVLSSPADAVDALGSVRSALVLIACGLAVAGLGLLVSPAASPAARGLGLALVAVAVLLLALGRSHLERRSGPWLNAVRTALSVAIVPVVGLAFLALLLTVAQPAVQTATP